MQQIITDRQGLLLTGRWAWALRFWQSPAPLLLIVAYAALVRFLGVNHGLPYLYTYDEYYLVNPTIKMMEHRSLNPGWFGYPGCFVMYVLLILYVLINIVYFLYLLARGEVAGFQEFIDRVGVNWDYNPVVFYFAGRCLMVLFAVITVYLVYRLGRRYFGRNTGLLAAACLALSPLHVYHSRLIRPDITATLLIVISVICLLIFFEKPKTNTYFILACIFGGFAVSAKYPSGIILVPIMVGAFMVDWKTQKLSCLDYLRKTITFRTLLSRGCTWLFIGFLIATPYWLLDFKAALKYFEIGIRTPHPRAETVPGIHNHLWYLTGALNQGIGGLFFELFAAVGLVVVLFRRRTVELLLFVFPLAFFIAIGFTHLRWWRWIIPLLPFEALLFGLGFVTSAMWLLKRQILRSVQKPVLLICIGTFAAACAFPIARSHGEIRKLTGPDTRTLAKEWIENNLEQGAKIVIESYGPPLWVKPARRFEVVNPRHNMILKEPLSFYQQQGADYLVLSSHVLAYLQEFPERFLQEKEHLKQIESQTQRIKTFLPERGYGSEIRIYRLNSGEKPATVEIGE